MPIYHTQKLSKKELLQKNKLSKFHLQNVDKLFQVAFLLWEVFGEDEDGQRVCNDGRKGKILLAIDECISDEVDLGLQIELEGAVVFAGSTI